MGACVSPMVFHTTHPFYRHLPPHTAIQKLPRCHGEQIGAASCLPRAILGRKVGGMAEDGWVGWWKMGRWGGATSDLKTHVKSCELT